MEEVQSKLVLSLVTNPSLLDNNNSSNALRPKLLLELTMDPTDNAL